MDYAKRLELATLVAMVEDLERWRAARKAARDADMPRALVALDNGIAALERATEHRASEYLDVQDDWELP